MLPQVQLSTTELIRRVALHHLIGYPTGIQTVQLRKLVEESLDKYMPTSNTKNATRYKNSIWNLEKIFPLYVEKHVVGHKNVLLLPTNTLFQEIDLLPLPNFEEFFAKKLSLEQILLDIEEQRHTDFHTNMRKLMYDLADVIADSEYYKFREQFKKSNNIYDFSDVLDDASPQDIMLFAHLTGILALVEKSIDDLFDED